MRHIPVPTRSDDLEYDAMRRYDIVKRYDRGIKGDSLSDSARRSYEELVATYGDPQPLRDYFD